MQNKLNKKNKCITFTALIALMASQSGFIAGMCTLWSGAGIPLAITGGALMIIGAPMSYDYHHDIQVTGWVFSWVGLALNEDSPEHVAALNEIPVSAEQAANLGVSIADIEHYNDSLNSIQAAYDILRADTKNSLLAWSAAKNQDIHQIELMMPETFIQTFAAHTGISTTDAQILLFKTFGPKTIH